MLPFKENSQKLNHHLTIDSISRNYKKDSVKFQENDDINSNSSKSYALSINKRNYSTSSFQSKNSKNKPLSLI